MGHTTTPLKEMTVAAPRTGDWLTDATLKDGVNKMVWYDESDVAAVAVRVMKDWEQHYNDMLNSAAKAAGWNVTYEAPTKRHRWHTMRLVRTQGDDPQSTLCAGDYALLHVDKPLTLAREMRMSGKWELSCEWAVPVETRLGALMWLNRYNPATSHELPSMAHCNWRDYLDSAPNGDWGLTLDILWQNKVCTEFALVPAG